VSGSTHRPELPDGLLALVGTWHGEGVAGSPLLPADYPFVQELTVREVGNGTLGYVSVSSLDGDGDDQTRADAAELMTEAGYWRWDAASQSVEVVMAAASGLAAVLVGQVRPDTGGEGAHVELVTDLVSRTATAQPITAERRLYSRRGDVLLYAVDQARTGHALAPRASAALHLA
jgi:hypothetical protein